MKYKPENQEGVYIWLKKQESNMIIRKRIDLGNTTYQVEIETVYKIIKDNNMKELGIYEYRKRNNKKMYIR